MLMGMRQITLLGDATPMARPLRPDRVYRTGVLAPMVGFQPGRAVMANADAFTLGPQTGMTLSGAPAWWARLSAWWQNVKLRAKAGRAGFMLLPPGVTPTSSVPTTASQPVVNAPGAAMPPIAGIGHPHLFNGRGSVPMYATAAMVGPATAMMPQQLVTAAYGQSSSLPTSAAEAAAKTTMMMWRGARWPWG